MRKSGHAAYVFFDNDQKSAAPKDALKLTELLSERHAAQKTEHSRNAA